MPVTAAHRTLLDAANIAPVHTLGVTKYLF
jgi:hypothetical protein